MQYRLPSGITAVSVGGQEFRADAAGIITVPASNDLIRAGLAELGCAHVAEPVPAVPSPDDKTEQTDTDAQSLASEDSTNGQQTIPPPAASSVVLIAKPDRFDSPTLEKAFLITALEQAGVDVGDKRRGLEVFRELYDATARRLAGQAVPA